LRLRNDGLGSVYYSTVFSNMLLFSFFISFQQESFLVQSKSTGIIELSEDNLMGNADVNYRLIGLNVSIHRHRLNLTQAELAEKAGMSKQFVGNIECGKAIPSLKTVLSLCLALGVTSDALLSNCANLNPDAPSTLRDDHDVFTESITEKLFGNEVRRIRNDPENLPEFDIILSDLPKDD